MNITQSPVSIIPSTKSNASEWVLWHKALKRRYGKATANQLWLIAWEQRGCANSGVVYFQTAGLLGGCDANTVELRDYLQKQGIQIDGGLFSFIPDTLDDMGDFATQAFDLSLTVILVIVGIIVLFLGLLAWNIGRNPQMVVDAGKAYANARSARAIAGLARTGGMAA